MNTWSQEEEDQLHESFVNRLYECKPVKTQAKTSISGIFKIDGSPQSALKKA